MTRREEETADTAAAQHRWYHKAASVLFAIFCFEIGLFLLYLPWSRYWDDHFLATYPAWHAWWASPFLRGAVSGLGIVNLYISFGEVFRLRRFSAGE